MPFRPPIIYTGRRLAWFPLFVVISNTAAALLPYCFHPAQNDVGSIPGEGLMTSENVDETVSGIGTPSIRSCNSHGPAGYVPCFSGPIDGAGKGQQHILEIVIYCHAGEFNFFPAERMGFARPAC